MADIVHPTQILNEDFDGGSLDTSKWTLTSGSLTVSGGQAYSTGWHFDTKNKVNIVKPKKIILEYRALAGGTGDMWCGFYKLSDDVINFSAYANENYYSQGVRIDLGGTFGSGWANSGDATNAWKEYRFTIDGSNAVIERFNSLSDVSPEYSVTKALSDNIALYTWYWAHDWGGNGSNGYYEWIRCYADIGGLRSPGGGVASGAGFHFAEKLKAWIPKPMIFVPDMSFLIPKKPQLILP